MSRSVTRRAPVDRDARREAFCNQLIASVEDLLSEGKNFSAITVDELALHAGVSRSKFYVHFRDKHDLLHSWFVQVVRDLDAASQGWWNLTGDATRDTLRAVLGDVLAIYRPKIPLLAATFDAATLDDRIAAETRRLIDRTAASLTRHILTGQKQGWIDTQLLPAETAAWIVWMAERGQAQMFGDVADTEFERLVDACAAIVWNMLYATAPARSRP